MQQPTLLYFEDEEALAQQLALVSGMPLQCIERHTFPDGETRLRLPTDLPERVVVLRSLHSPNTRIMDLLLAAPTARELGARHLTLVSPYLAYMRQDMAFRPGEAVSQRLVGRWLAELFEAVITIDPHLHRVHRLQDAVPADQALALSAAPLLAERVFREQADALLIGPDGESAQWIEQAARAHGFDHGVCHKTRHGDKDVAIQLPDVPVRGRCVVLLDDIASSGRTLVQASRLLLEAGARSVDVAVTHALFAGDAEQVIRSAGVRHIWSTDSVAHSSNVVSVAPLIAQVLQELARC